MPVRGLEILTEGIWTNSLIIVTGPVTLTKTDDEFTLTKIDDEYTLNKENG